MRAVAFQFIFFVYIFGVSAWAVDVGVFEGQAIRAHTISGNLLDTEDLAIERTEQIRAISNKTLNPSDSGNPVDRITDFATTGYFTAWTMLDLLTGSYLFAALGLLGLPAFFIFMIQLIFPMIVAMTVLFFVLGRY